MKTNILNTLYRFSNGLLAMVSLLTATGVFMHDTRVDKAALTAVSTPNKVRSSSAPIASRFSKFISADAHTHPDHNAAKSLISGFTHKAPSIHPREHHRRHMLQKFEPRGRHAFDNYNLPVIYD